MNSIKQLREEMGIDQVFLAKKLSVSQPTVSNWESGRKAPSNKSVLKLAKFFNVSADRILGREEQKEKPAINADDRLDHELISLLTQLEPSEEQRVLDFVAGLIAARKA